MIMNAVIAIALGLTPAQPDTGDKGFVYRDKDYAGLIGRYQQVVDRRGQTHLRGFDRLTGRPFELTVAQDGNVQGTVGDMYVMFTVRDAA